MGLRLNWTLDVPVLVFEGRGKLEYLEINFIEQEREPTTTNKTHKPKTHVMSAFRWPTSNSVIITAIG